MKKSSKQNKHNRKNSKKQQTKNQRRKQRKAKEQTKLDGLLGESPVGADGSQNADAIKSAQRRKALLAQFRQTQWKQKIKDGKAAGAKVEKVYNRGG